MPGRIPKRDDRGATLILVLIIVTVVGVVMGAVLLYAGTNLSSTVALRSQTGATYGVDAAGNAYLAELQNGEAHCDDPTPKALGTGGGSDAFYASSGAQSINAAVTCTTDGDDGQVTVLKPSGHGVHIDSKNLPEYALLALPTTPDEGITLATGTTACVVNGLVASTGSIAVAPRLIARANACTSGIRRPVQASVGDDDQPRCTGRISPACTRLSSVTPEGPPPLEDEGALPTDPSPTCSNANEYAAFVPGVYTDVQPLNSPCSAGAPTLEWFSPGTYYFRFAGTWNWSGMVVAGTPTSGATTDDTDGRPTTPVIAITNPQDSDSLAALAKIDPQAPCADPAQQRDYDGAQFVFDGATQIQWSGRADICATYNQGDRPTAIYGTPNATSITANTSNLHVNGYVYAPNSAIALTGGPYSFNWGAVVQTLTVTGSVSSPLVKLPPANAGFTETPTPYMSYRYINVYVCPASSTPCSTTNGDPQLRIKVQYIPGKPIKVLSWSTQS